MPRILQVLAGAVAAVAIATGGVQAQAVTAAQNDLNTLNYALLLERLESFFYTEGQKAFTEAQFIAANLTALDYSYFGLIAAHEKAHVDFLTSTTVLGSNAAQPCTYTLGKSLDSVASYVATAAVLEGVGVGAYDGAINAISDVITQQTAATIATVEARHAAYLNKLAKTMAPVNGEAGTAGSLDKALSPTEVVTAATPFIQSCPFNVSTILPQVRPGGVYTATNFDAWKPSNPNPLPGTTYTQEAYNNDNVALNYALVLEHLEADFYKQQQAKFTQAQFVSFFSSGTPAASGLKGEDVYNNFALIAAHEAAHVAFIESALNTRAPGTAYPVCTYNWEKVATVADYIAYAVTLEGTGVSAYDGAVNAFTDTALQQAAATIATVEARHTSYLSLVQRLTGVATANPFPGTDGQTSRDTATAPSDILNAVNALNIQTCSFTPQTPSASNNLPAGSASVHAPSFALFAGLIAALVALFRQ